MGHCIPGLLKTYSLMDNHLSDTVYCFQCTILKLYFCILYCTDLKLNGFLNGFAMSFLWLVFINRTNCFKVIYTQVEAKLGIVGIKEQKCRETREPLKGCETREVAYTFKIQNSINLGMQNKYMLCIFVQVNQSKN